MNQHYLDKNVALTKEITRALKLDHEPIAIAFLDEAPRGITHFDAPMSEPARDGRRGRVPAGCVLWKLAEERSFYTVPEDHGNCSIGSVTHGFKKLQEVESNEDIRELCECGWLGKPGELDLPVISRHYDFVYYGPLSQTHLQPDVVLLRINAKQMMVIHDAIPDLIIEGKPQCHIVPVAKEMRRPAVSLGCMLSRVRTGLPSSEVMCAMPYTVMSELVASIVKASEIESRVARYAASDSSRFETFTY